MEIKKDSYPSTLLLEAVIYNSSFETFRLLCEKVSGYYVLDRYPLFTDSELTCEDVEKDMKKAKEFIKILMPGESVDGQE